MPIKPNTDPIIGRDSTAEPGIPKSLRSHMLGKRALSLEKVIELATQSHPGMTDRDVVKVMMSDVRSDWLRSTQVRVEEGEGWLFLWRWV